eukprot:gnl/Ergobibamus_cyprinoides/5385.p3 GENE.gnl/Ergobibamus_cyprinoides/5385~~gnl/Ergobibamus_cyprinoides/5385.p3  ORF type:complete len:112 (+),score=23.28 gnl/Ergobibamus_cyprinoides/5385:111-446(+)
MTVGEALGGVLSAVISVALSAPAPAYADVSGDFISVFTDAWLYLYSSGVDPAQALTGCPLGAHHAAVAAFSQTFVQTVALRDRPGPTERFLRQATRPATCHHWTANARSAA